VSDTNTARADSDVIDLIETICHDLAASATPPPFGALDQRAWATLAE
jgi:hypothetical protein